MVDRGSIRVIRDEFHRAAKVLRHDPEPHVVLFEAYVRENEATGGQEAAQSQGGPQDAQEVQ